MGGPLGSGPLGSGPLSSGPLGFGPLGFGALGFKPNQGFKQQKCPPTRTSSNHGFNQSTLQPTSVSTNFQFVYPCAVRCVQRAGGVYATHEKHHTDHVNYDFQNPPRPTQTQA